MHDWASFEQALKLVLCHVVLDAKTQLQITQLFAHNYPESIPFKETTNIRGKIRFFYIIVIRKCSSV